LANLLKNLFFCPQQKTFITLQTSQINTGQGIQGFGRSPGFLTPLMVCQKKIWEDSPDERGDSVATTVEIHIVINNDYSQKPYSLLLGAHLSCLATAASAAGCYQAQKAWQSSNRQTKPDFS
jgi:hypothetical protein